MRFNVSAWSIRRPIPAVLAFAVLTILGLISFRAMSVTRFPNIDIPIVQVLITQSGAAPSELESQVTKKVEDAVASLNGVWHILSTVTDGSSSTMVQFNVGSVDIDRALNDVKDQLAKIRSDLPRTIDEPIVSRIDVEGLPIVTYAASAPGMSVEQLSWFIDEFGRPRPAEHSRRRRSEALRRSRPGDPCCAQPGEAARARDHRCGGERAGPRRQR